MGIISFSILDILSTASLTVHFLIPAIYTVMLFYSLEIARLS